MAYTYSYAQLWGKSAMRLKRGVQNCFLSSLKADRRTAASSENKSLSVFVRHTHIHVSPLHPPSVSIYQSLCPFICRYLLWFLLLLLHLSISIFSSLFSHGLHHMCNSLLGAEINVPLKRGLNSKHKQQPASQGWRWNRHPPPLNHVKMIYTYTLCFTHKLP